MTSPRLLIAAGAVWLAVVGLLVRYEASRSVRFCAFGSCGDAVAEPFRWLTFGRSVLFVTLVVAGLVAVLAERARS